ncbi:GHKL domain-containing protein [Inquilinus sp. KBS0705]|nr:GHKL domain-containing protein [Inquilinus sp. KBS0705]
MFTAIVVEKTYTPANNLTQTARILENNLHDRENYVYAAINDQKTLNEIKLLSVNPTKAVQYIDRFTVKKNIWIFTYINNKLDYWTGVKVIPDDVSQIKEGSSFLKMPNGYYEAIKHTEGAITIVFFIHVKNNYTFTNKYLQNNFNKELTTEDNIDIADFTDKGVYALHDVNNRYLFSVKLVKEKLNERFYYFVVAFWLMTILTLCVLVHNIISYMARRQQVYLALLVLAVFIIVFRFVNLHYGWPNFTRPLKLFDPNIYASNYVFPSLGDFCINILAITWFSSFLYTQRNHLLKGIPGKAVSYAVFAVCILVLVVTSTTLLHIFYGLIVNSKISFDVNNVLNLSVFSLLGVLMLCFSFLTFILLTETILTICIKLNIAVGIQAVLFIATILIITAVVGVYVEFSLFYVFWMVLVLIRGHAYFYNDRRFTSGAFISIVVICALIASTKLNRFEADKERETRKALVQRLEVPDDATADILFKKIEKQIIVDPLLVQYFRTADHTSDYLKTRLQKLYFDRYLSRYDFKVHEYNDDNQPVSADKNYTLDVFKDMVVYSSFKVSDYFYRENDSFGFQSYFAILPVIDEGRNLGTIVIELRSKPLLANGTFPELLIDKEIVPADEFKDYSYAFYTDNSLVGQSGTVVYSIKNTSFKGKLKQFTFANTKSAKQGWYNRFTKFSHLIYQPSKRNLIVVTKDSNLLLSNITAITFFFVVILLFDALVLAIRLLWIKVRIFNINNNRIKWGFKLNFDKILYKTRIQFSMIFAVVVTLVLVGFITFFSISSQYQAQQDKLIRSKIMQLASAIESSYLSSFTKDINEESRVNFDRLADTYSADITLFNLRGVPLMSTQPKIYEYGLIAPRINGRAFIALSKEQKSEVVNEEKVGSLVYKSAYVPLRNLKHETVAYLQLPYFSNVTDYTEQIGSLLNIMINVYALVFIAIGLFAVIIARQITAPLNFIQYNLSRTIYGKKNEPIKWERDDEIGALVKEYNNMIAALENSAQKLAQSERETAWREMAKQVAHEIKNPLTPLKLGLQLLDKSWKDKDPKFDLKFERFSKSFVEQIESLSSIASEFSAFAKMPDTRIESINIFDMLGQAVTIFKHMDNVTILMQIPDDPFFISADRDQLLRCFNNLLKNAIEATPQDTQCVIEINFLTTSKNILLTIKDNGNGIPENMRDKIFEPNFTTKSSGTGLGLAFVKNSIENASGKVWFETTTGTGTTFYLSFPAVNEAGLS